MGKMYYKLENDPSLVEFLDIFFIIGSSGAKTHLLNVGEPGTGAVSKSKTHPCNRYPLHAHPCPVHK
jgi:hypothetical protein